MSAIVFNIIYLVALLVISGINIKSYIETKKFKININFILLFSASCYFIAKHFNLLLKTVNNEFYYYLISIYVINSFILLLTLVFETKYKKNIYWLFVGLEILITSINITNNI